MLHPIDHYEKNDKKRSELHVGDRSVKSAIFGIHPCTACIDKLASKGSYDFQYWVETCITFSSKVIGVFYHLSMQMTIVKTTRGSVYFRSAIL